MSKAKISVKNLNAWFWEKQALRDVNVTIDDRKVTAIIGPSGCGKSTFIRCFKPHPRNRLRC